MQKQLNEINVPISYCLTVGKTHDICYNSVMLNDINIDFNYFGY